MASYIRTFETTAGFLERRRFTFSKGLNCIIGARGTCKSTIVETLRFAFPQDRERDNHIQGLPCEATELPGKGIIAATLSPGSVRVEMSHDSTDFTIERDTVPAGTLRVFKDGSVPWSNAGDLIQSAEIYSQGELYLIAKDPTLRLALVDRPHIKDIRRFRKEREALANRIADLGKEIRNKRLEIAKRRSGAGQLGQLQAALAELQKDRPQEVDELEIEHRQYLQRERIRERAEAALLETKERLAKIVEALRGLPDYESLAEDLRSVKSAAANDVASFLTKSTETAREQLRQLASLELPELAVEALRTDFVTASARYFHLLNQAQERQAVLKKEAAYREEISRYQGMVDEAKAIEDSMQLLIAERDDKRTQVASIMNSVYEMRSAEVERINSAFHNRILLTLRPPTDLPSYREEIKRLLAGSSLRDQDGLSREIAQTLPPQQFIRIIEQQDAPHLSDLLDRDLSQVNRLLGHLADHPDIFQLESYVSDEVLDITMYDKGQPKGMGELSKGQMATALLPLILRHSEGPLIIDQPEDDLDNSFIYDTLVQQVQLLKSERQMIFVTHNANIPVLGEADAVIVMDMESPNRTSVPRLGTVDDQRDSILRLLEGGKDAFDARANKYGLGHVR